MENLIEALAKMKQENLDMFKDVYSEINNMSTPKDGEQGPVGPKGEDGKDGKDGSPGQKGTDGRDGSPDTAEEIIKKLQTVKRPWMDIEAIDGDFNCLIVFELI